MNCFPFRYSLCVCNSLTQLLATESLLRCLGELQSRIRTSPAYLFLASQDFCKKFSNLVIHNLVSFSYMKEQHANQNGDVGANEEI